jgi:hypothetical protein
MIIIDNLQKKALVVFSLFLLSSFIYATSWVSQENESLTEEQIVLSTGFDDFLPLDFDDIDELKYIVMDEEGYLYLAGYTYSTNFYTSPDAFDTTHNGAIDIFVMKISPDGKEILNSTLIGGSQGETLFAIILGDNNDIFLSGSTTSPDFPTTFDAIQPLYGGVVDTFIVRLSSDCSTLLYSTYFGGSQGENI